MISTLAERLKDAMKGPPRVTGVALAKACKITPTSVSDWLTGKSKTMEGSNLMAAARRLNVDPDWLASGVGVKRPFSLWRSIQETKGVYLLPDPLLVEATQLLNQLSPDQWPATISFMKWQLAEKAPPRNGQTLPMAVNNEGAG